MLNAERKNKFMEKERKNICIGSREAMVIGGEMITRGE
jgi:hypothetical protein